MKSFITRRSAYTLLILGFLVSAILFTLSLVKQRQELRKKAAPATTISLQASPAAIKVGDAVTVNVMIDSGSNLIAAADIRLSYDPQVFQAISLEKGSFLPNILVDGAVANGAGRIVVTSIPLKEKAGQGTLAVLKLVAIAPATQTTINFTTGTQVTALNETGDVATSKQPLTVDVTNQEVVQPDTTLAVFPQTLSITKNETFYLLVQLSAGTNQVAGADLSVLYDSAMLEGRNITSAGFLPNVLTPGTIGSGVAKIILGAIPGSPKQGTGTLAILEFKALAEGMTSVSIDPTSSVSNVSSNINILKNRISSSVTVLSSAAVAASPASGVCSASTPAQVIDLTASVLNSNQVRLAWTLQTNTTHYGIVYGLKPGVYIYGAANVGNVSSFTVSGLAAATRYYFAVFSVNDCAPSGYSNEVAATVSGSPIGGEFIPRGSGKASLTPKVKASPAGKSPFVLVDPNKEAIPFLVGKSPEPSAANVNLPPLVTAQPETTATASSSFFTPLRIALLAIIILLTGFFLFVWNRNKV